MLCCGDPAPTHVIIQAELEIIFKKLYRYRYSIKQKNIPTTCTYLRFSSSHYQIFGSRKKFWIHNTAKKCCKHFIKRQGKLTFQLALTNTISTFPILFSCGHEGFGGIFFTIEPKKSRTREVLTLNTTLQNHIEKCVHFTVILLSL